MQLDSDCNKTPGSHVHIVTEFVAKRMSGFGMTFDKPPSSYRMRTVVFWKNMSAIKFQKRVN